VSTPFLASYVLLYLIVIFQGLLLLGAVRAIHELRQGHVAPAEPEEGAQEGERLLNQEAPRFEALDLAGNLVGTEQLRGRSSLVLFVSPNCSSCMLTLDELHAVQHKVDGGNVLVVCGARDADCRNLASDHNLTVPVVADEDASIGKLFDVTAFPTAVLLNAGTRVVSYGHPMRGEELREMAGDELDLGDDTVAATTPEGR